MYFGLLTFLKASFQDGRVLLIANEVSFSWYLIIEQFYGSSEFRGHRFRHRPMFTLE